MASDNPEIIGNTEIIGLTSYPEKVFIDKPFIIEGDVQGRVTSTQARLLINDEVIETVAIQNQEFSFTYALTVFYANNITVKVQGLSDNTINSEWIEVIPTSYISIAESMAQIYLSLKNVLEDCYHENVELYDPTLKTGDRILTLITKIEEI